METNGALGQALMIESFAQTAYRKCECCNRVRDIYFRLNIKDAETHTMIVGSIDLCKDCGENLGEIIGQKPKTERVLTEFKFND